ncbi:hypothetical protein BJ684DRAFT_18341 [Piptocephalis cylindrospora]|uniref:Uncharacterized protein n=1 Tax=Piptocephalis cylindrospora TaxID=1907219 RepID=A0A4P9Y921_9FUNG|nr:hypothetical protein BJ684DRAFT_18341 [Piptocephalis cylindrospora]|eukprot:RKP15324.1 hypothetical protein BJ684DRAFT_18341 [Piptocephalis cylindrospora]
MHLTTLLTAGLFLANTATSSFHYKNLHYVEKKDLKTFKEGRYYSTFTIPLLRSSTLSKPQGALDRGDASENTLLPFIKNGLSSFVQSSNYLLDQVYHCSTVHVPGQMAECYRRILRESLHNDSVKSTNFQAPFQHYINSHDPSTPLGHRKLYGSSDSFFPRPVQGGRKGIIRHPSYTTGHSLPSSPGVNSLNLEQLKKKDALFKAYTLLISHVQIAAREMADFEIKLCVKNIPKIIAIKYRSIKECPRPVDSMIDVINSTTSFTNKLFLAIMEVLEETIQEVSSRPHSHPDPKHNQNILTTYKDYTACVEELIRDWREHALDGLEKSLTRTRSDTLAISKDESEGIISGSRLGPGGKNAAQSKEEATASDRRIRFSPKNSYQNAPTFPDSTVGKNH